MGKSVCRHASVHMCCMLSRFVSIFNLCVCVLSKQEELLLVKGDLGWVENSGPLCVFLPLRSGFVHMC